VLALDNTRKEIVHFEFRLNLILFEMNIKMK
jgi:hypothetical protein